MINNIQQLKLPVDDDKATSQKILPVSSFYTLSTRLYMITPRWILRMYDWIRFHINPRQKWIKQYVKWNCWCDKTELIPDFLFGCVIDFIEGERALDYIDYSSTEEDRAFENLLKECYEYAKTGRKELEQRLNQAYDDLDERDQTLTWDDYYKEVNAIETEIGVKNTMYMQWIINNHEKLWV
jgi:hypothetical protein